MEQVAFVVISLFIFATWWVIEGEKDNDRDMD